MAQGKTIIEWFQELPRSYRTLAIKNIVPGRESKAVRSIYVALDLSCTWSKTPQGQDFWCSVHSELINACSAKRPINLPRLNIKKELRKINKRKLQK